MPVFLHTVSDCSHTQCISTWLTATLSPGCGCCFCHSPVFIVNTRLNNFFVVLLIHLTYLSYLYRPSACFIYKLYRLENIFIFSSSMQYIYLPLLILFFTKYLIKSLRLTTWPLKPKEGRFFHLQSFVFGGVALILAHWLTRTHVYMEIERRRKIEAGVEVGYKAAYRWKQMWEG